MTVQGEGNANGDSMGMTREPTVNVHVAEAGQMDEPRFLEHLARVGALVKGDHLPEAELEALRALQLRPTDMRGLKLLGLVRFKRGRYAEAREVYEALARATPDDLGVRMSLGLIALKMDWADEAVAELEMASRSPAAPAKVWTYLGYAYARLGKNARAAEAFRRVGQDALAAEAESGELAGKGLPDDSDVRRVSAPKEAPAPAVEAPAAQEPSAGWSRGKSGFFSPDPKELTGEPSQPVTAELEVEGFAPASDDIASETGEHQGTTLTNFVLGRLLDVPVTDEFTSPFASLVGEVLRFSVNGQACVRAPALLAATGALQVTTAQRRSRGRTEDVPLGDAAGDFVIYDGRGELWLAPSGTQTRLLALTLEDDILFMRQSRVVAFDQDVVWEAGRLPGDALPLLQLRGTGRAILDIGEERFRAFNVPQNRPLWVERDRLLGWVGRVVAQAVRPAGALGRRRGCLVACEGEGVLLVSTHGLLDQPTDERP
ncbi:MAG: AIM24 family protein [Deltaproteobacteria bacterium]|nr:AIM24 family protein [Deltaproteobacteria bacterium]